MKKWFVIALILILVFPQVALAQNPCQWGTSASLGKCVTQVYKWALGISAVLAMFMLVIGGYYVMTSAGNAEQASTGKSYIQSALLGVVLLFAAYLILNTINPDLVRFRDFSNNPFQQPPVPPPPPPGTPQVNP